MGLGYSKHGKKKKERLSKEPLGTKTKCGKKKNKTKQKNNFEKRPCFYPKGHHCFVSFLNIHFFSPLFHSPSLFLWQPQEPTTTMRSYCY